MEPSMMMMPSNLQALLAKFGNRRNNAASGGPKMGVPSRGQLRPMMPGMGQNIRPPQMGTIRQPQMMQSPIGPSPAVMNQNPNRFRLF